MAIEELVAGQQIQFAHTANNVVGVLAVACSASDTTIALSPGGGALFPNAPFYCSIEFEVLWCLSKSGDSLIVQRGQDGTTAASHVVGVSVEMRNNAGLWNDAYNGINAVSTDVGNLAAGITNKTALPPDTTFAGNTQELTHKTIDLTDISKGNVIIGTVQPDPASLPLQNILVNGGFEEWYGPNSLTLGAGTPTSGGRNSWMANGWILSGVNDSAISATRETANPDPLSPSGVDVLLNISTVQAADWVGLQNGLDGANILPAFTLQTDVSDIKKIIGAAVSISSRIKLISGSNVTVRFNLQYYDGSYHSIISSVFPVSSSSYATFKFENQIIAPNVNTVAIWAVLQFQGVGQIAIDNVMLNMGNTAVGYRPRPALKPILVENIAVNGGFEIWQRGTVFSANGFSADRWNLGFSLGSGGSCNVVKNTSTLAPNSAASAACTMNPGTGGTPSYSLIQIIENAAQYRGKMLSISALINQDLANGWAVRFVGYGGASGGNYSPNASSSIVNSWVRIGGSAMVPTDATSLQIEIVWIGPGTSILFVDNVALTVSPIPVDYVSLPPADELARCQRYYERHGFQASWPRLIGSPATATAQIYQSIPFHVTKFGSPSMTKVGTWTVGGGMSGQPALSDAVTDGYGLSNSCSVLAAYDCYPTPSSGVTAEANP